MRTIKCGMARRKRTRSKNAAMAAQVVTIKKAGKKRKRLGGGAFTCGGDKGRDGIPCGEPASEALGACGINDGREEHQKMRDDRDASP